MESKVFIKNILIVIVILTVVFLSQQSYFRTIGNYLYSKYLKQVSLYFVKNTDWFKENVYPKVSGEVAQKREDVKEEIIKQKNNFAQIIWGNFKNYFAEKFSKTFDTKVE